MKRECCAGGGGYYIAKEREEARCVLAAEESESKKVGVRGELERESLGFCLFLGVSSGYIRENFVIL